MKQAAPLAIAGGVFLLLVGLYETLAPGLPVDMWENPKACLIMMVPMAGLGLYYIVQNWLQARRERKN